MMLFMNVFCDCFALMARIIVSLDLLRKILPLIVIAAAISSMMRDRQKIILV